MDIATDIEEYRERTQEGTFHSFHNSHHQDFLIDFHRLLV